MAREIEELLNDVGFKIGTMRQARNRFADQLAPEFRIFDYLRTDEMGLSKCLASLLDPNGKHGQGSVFLNVFLEILGVGESWVAESKRCTVILEKPANDQRRIDIYLEFPDAIIGIENKPWAADQCNQLKDYARYLGTEARTRKWLLVFLSNRDPSTESIDQESLTSLRKDSRFIQRDYAATINWLDICACKSKNGVVSVFIEELAKFIRENINGASNMSDEKEVITAVLKSPETIGSSFQIFRAMDGAKEELLNKFRIDLATELGKHDFMLVDWGMGNWGAYTGFGVQFGKQVQYSYLCFEFERVNLNEFCWGIARQADDDFEISLRGDANKIMESEFGIGKSSKRWPWYVRSPNNKFDGEMRNWQTSEKPWVMIKSGALVQKIVELALEVRKFFDANSQLFYEGKRIDHGSSNV